MGWKEKYQQASFRGVQFFVARTENTGGRRLVAHQFPEKDEGSVEDLGRQLRRFTLTAYIIGEDYFVARDNLIKALELGGSGTLVHPYFGSLEVYVMKYTQTEDRNNMRQARFGLIFREAGTKTFPTSIIDTKSNLLNKTFNVFEQAQKAFLKVYSVLNKPAAMLQNVDSTINNTIGLTESVRRIVGADAGYRRKILAISQRGQQLVYQAQNLYNDFEYMLSYGTDPTSNDFAADSDNSKDQFNELTQLFSVQPPVDLGLEDPSVAVANMTQEVATSAASSVISVMPFESVNQALELQSIILDQIDKINGRKDVDDNVYEAFRELKAAIVLHIEEEQTNLSRLISYTPTESIPSLTLSQLLYGSYDQADNIVSRNKIGHPGFIPGNQSVEVLIDE